MGENPSSRSHSHSKSHPWLNFANMGGGHELEEARQKYQNKDSQSWCVPFFFLQYLKHDAADDKDT